MTIELGACPQPLYVPLRSVTGAFSRAGVMNFLSGSKIRSSIVEFKSPPTTTAALRPAICCTSRTTSFTPSRRATTPLWSRCVLK